MVYNKGIIEQNIADAYNKKKALAMSHTPTNYLRQGLQLNTVTQLDLEILQAFNFNFNL